MARGWYNPAMETIFLAAAVFGLALAAMSVGVVFSGRKLSSSCGGLATKEGELLGDCHCAKKEADVCASDDELVRLAEIGNPKRKDTFRKEREAFLPRAEGESPLEV